MNPKLRIMIFITTLWILSSNALAATWTYLRIPHLAVGGGYTSYLTISDPQGIPSRQIKVDLYRDDGSPLTANFVGLGPASSYSFVLTANAEKSIVLTGNTLLTGWVQIASEDIGNLDASLRFSAADNSGNVSDAVGILPSEPNSSWALSFEKYRSTDYVGIAIANPWARRINVTVDLFQGGTRVPGTQSYSRTLEPMGHWAGFVHELFPGPYQVLYGPATLRVSSASDTFSAVALRGEGSQYSSLPAGAGVQYWTWNYQDSSGVLQSGRWTWRFNDGFSFMGYEVNLANPNLAVRTRGMLDAGAGFFTLERWLLNSDGSQQSVVFLGTTSKEGDSDVINGTRVTLNKSGIIADLTTFKAMRSR